MVKGDIKNFFEDYLGKESIFKNKKVLQTSYTPETIPHRDDQVNEIAGILAPVLRNEKPSNLFLYGKTGTGKTLSVLHVVNNLKSISKSKGLPLHIAYINCKLKRVADTEYRLISSLAREFGQENIPVTGLPTDEVYRLFIKNIEKGPNQIILILDEIDQLVKKAGDEILYNLTRINTELKNTQITFIGISNDLRFANDLDPRVKSSLAEEDLNFPSYNALQLQDILVQRSSEAFKEKIISEGVIEKCAAYAAREHGDARRALDLLRVAGELAERKNDLKVKINHIDEAESKIENDMVVEVISTLPKQSQLTLLAIFDLYEKKGNEKFFTGDVYEIYMDLGIKCGLKPLTQRRLSDLIAELDMLGIINAKVISKGRYGRTKEIGLAMPQSSIPGLISQLRGWLSL
ncbi:ORC1-type DNA replication protein [Candidatus Woesearchaeota archaeon]|jgi:archaeal cell division control protein 6|nr:ORC1-type DNA replication protein [Candidatus Woesearchaeota archaeon]